MATLFLSYRRTDSPQACRVYDWLVQRFGKDAVFMDVAGIPVAVNFPDFLRQTITSSKVLIALIGADWLNKIHQADDPVRNEIEAAIAGKIQVLPVLIGNTPMPNAEELPASLSSIAGQNAVTVGVLHDFHTHMQSLLPKIESILGALAMQSVVTADAEVVSRACGGIIRYLEGNSYRSTPQLYAQWLVIGTSDLYQSNQIRTRVTLFLHRIARLAELLELHFILSFWAGDTTTEQVLAGWVMRQLEQTPIIPDEFFKIGEKAAEWNLKIRRSDEDARQVWKMITTEPLRLSLAYVATVSPKNRS